MLPFSCSPLTLSLSDRSFLMDVRAGCLRHNACFSFQDFGSMTEVFGRMSAGISGQKLPLSVKAQSCFSNRALVKASFEALICLYILCF